MARTLPFDPGPDDAAEPAFVARFVAGARAALDGAAVVFAEPRLRLLAVVPMVVHVALFVALLSAGLMWGAGPLGDRLAPADAADTGSFSSLLETLARVAAVFLVVVGSFVGAVVAGSVVCDPLYDVLSERTEELLLGRAVGEPLSVGSVVAGILREASATAVRLCVWGAGFVVLTALSFTPLVVVAAPLSFAWTALFSAWEYLSRSLSRHAVHIGGRFGAVFSHKATFLGFGAAATVLSTLPLTAPLLVVGGTRAYLALAARGRVASRLTDDDRARLRALLPHPGRSR